MDPSSGYNFTPTLHDDTYDFINPSKLNLSGQNVLITGASKGVGRAMAVSFAKAGASGITLLARSTLESVEKDVVEAAKQSNRPKPQILCIKCDTTSQKDVEAAAETFTSTFGHLDVLINNAGYLEEFKPIADSDPEEWWKTFEVNIKGVYLVTRSFIPILLKGNGKTIIQTSSIGAHVVMHGASSYQTTKQAVLRFNNFIMNEYGDNGMLAYGIHPGAVMTELASGMPKKTHSMLNDRPELCGDTVPWLVSEKRDWLADRYVSVTWDMQELLGRKEDIVKNDLLKVKMRV